MVNLKASVGRRGAPERRALPADPACIEFGGDYPASKRRAIGGDPCGTFMTGWFLVSLCQSGASATCPRPLLGGTPKRTREIRLHRIPARQARVLQ